MTQPPRRGRGQPPFSPTLHQRQLVNVMRAHGDTLPIICTNLGISEKTLRKHFKVELADGFEQVKAAIGVSIVNAALKGNIYAAKYWLSCFGGPEWRVTERRLLGGIEVAPPIPINTNAKVVIYLPHNNREPLKPDHPEPTPPETPA
jgi:hypothetical protein